MITLQIIDETQRFDSLREEWSALLPTSRADCVFLTFEWLNTWWKHLGEGRRLFIVTVRDGSKMIAIAPLAMSRTLGARTLEFLGSGSVGSDYLDFIVDHDYEDVASAALTEFFSNAGLSLRLHGVKEDSIVASVITNDLREQHWRARKVALQVSPYIDVRSLSFDAYLATVGASHRYNFRRRLRNLEKQFSVEIERPRSDEQRRAALGTLIDLHVARWNKRGGSDGLHEERLVAFHDEFTQIASGNGWLRLRVLSLDGRPAAAFYGLRYRRTYSFYQSGFDEAFVQQSVGLVLIGLTIREAIAEGVSEYDFLHGDESYKFLWTNSVRPLFRYELYPPTMIGRVHRDSVAALAAPKKIVKRAIHAPLTR